MKKYIKDEVVITAGTPIVYDDKIIISPTEADYLTHDWVEYTESAHVKTLEEAKADKILEIEAYDVSDNVNSFMVNNQECWINKADRVGLMNSTNIEIASGKTNTSLWLNHVKLTIPCVSLINMLSILEEYALQCYNVTELHKATVLSFDNIEEVDNFDTTSDYPEQLVFNI